MYLLLQAAHYDLAVPRDSIETKYPQPKESDGYEPEEDEDGPNDEAKTSEERLTDMENKYANLKTKYSKCLDKIKHLESKLSNKEAQPKTNEALDNDSDSSENLQNLAKSKSKGFRKTTPQSEPEEMLKCSVCYKTFTKKEDFNKHIEMHDKDGDWVCTQCSFQTNSTNSLKKHKDTAHNPSGEGTPGCGPREGNQKGRTGSGDKRPLASKADTANTCRTCCKDFIYKIDLKKHINESQKTYKPCRNLDSCTYKVCRFNHKVYPEGHQVCYECGKSFKTVHELMRHRKATHKAVLCKDYLKGNCGYSSEDCYYTHTSQSQLQDSQGETPSFEQPQSKSQGFWDLPCLKDPPSKTSSPKNGPSQAEWSQMKTMLGQLNRMVESFH